MIRAVVLGLRLAGVGTAPARLRGSMVALSSAVGAWLMLAVVAIARAEAFRQTHGGGQVYSTSELSRLLAVIVGSIALPVLVLAATAGRLSASVRDRRLAALRLLGISPQRTRVVAVTETGAWCAAGVLFGAALFAVTHPLLAHISIGGLSWPATTLRAHLSDYVIVVVAVLVATVAVTASPRLRARPGRPSAGLRPSLWRAAPLLLGSATCLVMLNSRQQFGTAAWLQMGAISVTAIGAVLVLPLLTWCVARTMLTSSSGPATLIAARRMQAQPAGVSRIISALAIGLFLVTGGRAVVTDFEYANGFDAPMSIHNGQRASITLSARERPAAPERLGHVRGVRRSTVFPLLSTRCSTRSPAPDSCHQAVVGTCDQLRSISTVLTGCRDDEVAWIGEPYDRSAPPTRWTDDEQKQPLVQLPRPGGVLTMSLLDDRGDNLTTGLDQDVFIPTDIAKAAHAPIHTGGIAVVEAGPGRDLGDHLAAAGFSVSYQPDFAQYDFTSELRALVWSMAAIVLSIGLLSLALGAVDRAVTRRREVMSLQLIGIPARVLRHAQWIETGVPVVLASGVSIAFGLLAGATYLRLGDDSLAVPWRQSLVLLGTSLLVGIAISAATTVAASPRIRAELIRAE